MKCLYCHKQFDNNRCTAKYCSTKCRVYFNRSTVTLKQIPTVTLSNHSVTLTHDICKEHGIDKELCKFMKHKH